MEAEIKGIKKPEIREIKCKTALSSSSLVGVGYALNPYRGCEHACVYCYSPYVLKEQREWGSFVDVKINLPQVLAREVVKKDRKLVGISTVTDAYQRAELKYEITRRALEILLRKSMQIYIQTKSALVLRDLDIISCFREKEVGFTITTLNEEIRRKTEPKASSGEARVNALEEIKERGIRTFIFLGPIMPRLCNTAEIEKIIKTGKKARVDFIYFDKLRIKKGMEDKILRLYERHFPEHYEALKKILVSKAAYNAYFYSVKKDIEKLCRKHGIKHEMLF